MSRTNDPSILVRNVVIGMTVIGLIAAAVWLFTRDRDGVEEIDAAAAGAVEPVGELPDPTATARPQSVDSPDEELARQWTDAVGQPPLWPVDISTPESCQQVELDLARGCSAIDARAADAELRKLGGACVLLESIAAELARRPPDLSAELRSYPTMLANVFHLFRVIGRPRIQVLRRVLERHPELVEPLALALYRWSISRESCDDDGSTRMSVAAMYAYSGFLFNTLGGQAYLRRRTPRTEALACFYALQVLDQAIAAGHNPEGLDPRSEIPRCRALLDSQPLVFSARYVDTLDRMARRWETRTSLPR